MTNNTDPWDRLFEAAQRRMSVEMENPQSSPLETEEAIVSVAKLIVDYEPDESMEDLMNTPLSNGTWLGDYQVEADYVGQWAVMSPKELSWIAVQQILTKHLREWVAEQNKPKPAPRQTAGAFFASLPQEIFAIEHKVWETPDNSKYGEERDRATEHVDELEKLLKKAAERGYELTCALKAVQKKGEADGQDMSWVNNYI